MMSGEETVRSTHIVSGDQMHVRQMEPAYETGLHHLLHLLISRVTLSVLSVFHVIALQFVRGREVYGNSILDFLNKYVILFQIYLAWGIQCLQ